MQFRIVRRTSLTPMEWDSWIDRLDTATYFHSSAWLDFVSQYPIQEDLSFLCFENDETLLAACPLAIFVDSESRQVELSFAGNPLGEPALAQLKPSIKRHLMDEIMSIYASEAKKSGANRIRMVSHPLKTSAWRSGTESLAGIPAAGGFDLLRYALIPRTINIGILYLHETAQSLEENLSKDHRRHIRRAQKANISMKVYDRWSEIQETEKAFKDFQKAHFVSAGKATRPQDTWDSMLRNARRGHVSLFVAYLADEPISYLCCNQFGAMARSWSQVNIEQFEKEYSPRHYLEWRAILHYRDQRFKYYELGEQHYGPSLLYSPSEKEISISEFKARYGTHDLPLTYWTGYLGREALREDMSSLSQSLTHSWPTDLSYRDLTKMES